MSKISKCRLVGPVIVTWVESHSLFLVFLCMEDDNSLCRGYRTILEIGLRCAPNALELSRYLA